jgi:hypothetical protein
MLQENGISSGIITRHCNENAKKQDIKSITELHIHGSRKRRRRTMSKRW